MLSSLSRILQQEKCSMWRLLYVLHSVFCWLFSKVCKEFLPGFQLHLLYSNICLRLSLLSNTLHAFTVHHNPRSTFSASSALSTYWQPYRYILPFSCREHVIYWLSGHSVLFGCFVYSSFSLSGWKENDCSLHSKRAVRK